MKRDFKEEYQNYIESDIPDLWSRIEPNLREKEAVEKEPAVKELQPLKTKQNTGKKSRLFVIKTAAPVAACLCVLVIGIGAMQLHNGAKSMEEHTESAPAGVAETEPAEAETDETMEEFAQEEMEAPIYEEETDTAACNEETEASAYDEETEATVYDEAADKGTRDVVEISDAVLMKITVASEQMQEKGYAYVYTFQLDDNSRILVYVTTKQCRELEKQGMEPERKEAYCLSVLPMEVDEDPGSEATETYSLQKIEKLP